MPNKKPRFDRRVSALAAVAALLAAAPLTVFADRDNDRDDDWRGWKAHKPWHHPGKNFNRVSTLANYLNNGDDTKETVSEIVAATKDGNTLVYTDSPLEQIGIVDITFPSSPISMGTIAVGGEPTSVDVLGNDYALVAVNTSNSFTDTSGKLVVVKIGGGILGEVELGGQPDSIKISPDGKHVAIVIENERDEEICVGGSEDGTPVPEDEEDIGPGDITAEACETAGGQVGVIPQNGPDTSINNPAGFLVIVDIIGSDPGDWVSRKVELTGLADFAPSDPEPEFVDVNEDNEAVVSLQENNHIVIVDLESGKVTGDFPAGRVTLKGVDATEDDVISLTEKLEDVPREPDAIAWVRDGRHGEYKIGTANEGDLFGGSRGFTLFDRKGKVLYDSGNTFEELAVQHGHYPEGRSENKGSEPESIEFARFGKRDYLFVGSERGSFVAVYEIDGKRPNFKQLLPAPLGPEGVLAIPQRGLLAVSGEEDDPSFGVRSGIMLYRLEHGEPDYPQIVSKTRKGSPIPWSALSGMTSVPGNNDKLLAVWDSFYSESRIFEIDVSKDPAVIRKATTIRGGTGDYDPEGIVIAPDGTTWIASEGNASDSRPNRLLQLDKKGKVIAEIGLPQKILDCRKAERDLGDVGKTATHGSGFEGVAVLPGRRGYRLLVAQQRGWDYTTPGCRDLDDVDETAPDGDLNAKGQPNHTRIWTYDPRQGTWGHIAWELAALPASASWVGLSEITRAPDGSYVLIERDNRTGNFAELKTLVKVKPGDAVDGRISATEKTVYDLIPELEATNGWISDKPEGVAITRDGNIYLVTDNDGVDDWSGETWFQDLGDYRKVFGGWPLYGKYPGSGHRLWKRFDD